MRRAWSLASIVGIGMIATATTAIAQSVPPPAVRSVIDENGVNLLTGHIDVRTPEVSIGQAGHGGLAYSRYFDTEVAAWRDDLSGVINSNGADFTVTLMGASQKFTVAGGVFTEVEPQGATLTFNSVSNTYLYTTADGSQATFDKALAGTQPTQANEGRITSLLDPSGERLTFTYVNFSGLGFPAQRLQSVNNNLGYQLKFEYESNTADASGLKLVKVTAINNAVDYCDPAANGCVALSQAWPSLTFAVSGDDHTVTDALSRTTRYTILIGKVTAIRRPSSATDNITIGYYLDGRVTGLSDGVSAWSYTYNYSGSSVTTTLTAPLSRTRVVVANTVTGTVTSDTDALSRTTSYLYDAANRLQRVTNPEGDYFQYAYDSRGNVTQSRHVAKAGSGIADIVASATFAASCVNPITCNSALSVTDPRGFTTDFTYDATHGGLLSATSPAPTLAAVRPQARYAYTSLTASYRQSSGGGLVAGPAVYKLTSSSACATLASCAGGADEIISSIGFSGSNNLLPTSATNGAGNGSLSAVTQFNYDDVGNLLTIDRPIAGTADTTRFRYDIARQNTGVIGPDPDGAGPLKHRAMRSTYNLDGQVTSVEQGTVNSQSDGDWAAFVSLLQSTATYDSQMRQIKSAVISGGTTHSLMQFSYDAASRLQCAVERMNPAQFATPPASACTLGVVGSFGADRAQQYVYDVADQLLQVKTALGTPAQQNAVTMTYTANSQLATVADPNGNLTTLEYDGVDRLKKTRFPTPANGAVSSVSDYQEIGYDASSNPVSVRLRDGTLVLNSFDDIGRAVSSNAPGAPDDLSFNYDNLGRLLSATRDGRQVSTIFDALGRKISVTAPLGTVSYQYDLAGSRTRTTYPDAFYISYDLDVLGRVTVVREYGAASGPGVLASYAYDDFGRQSALNRGNGAHSTASYDSASRLSQLVHDPSHTSGDQTSTFAWNPADQQVSRTSSNSAYAFQPLPNGTQTYTNNGLNQHPTVGGVSYTYDARGNLTSDGVRTFSYSANNELTGVVGGASLIYDAAGRLDRAVAGGSTTQFLYDGADVIAEYDGVGTLLRRYVHGPSANEPLVWYEGLGQAIGVGWSRMNGGPSSLLRMHQAWCRQSTHTTSSAFLVAGIWDASNTLARHGCRKWRSITTRRAPIHRRLGDFYKPIQAGLRVV